MGSEDAERDDNMGVVPKETTFDDEGTGCIATEVEELATDVDEEETF